MVVSDLFQPLLDISSRMVFSAREKTLVIAQLGDEMQVESDRNWVTSMAQDLGSLMLMIKSGSRSYGFQGTCIYFILPVKISYSSCSSPEQFPQAQPSSPLIIQYFDQKCINSRLISFQLESVPFNHSSLQLAYFILNSLKHLQCFNKYKQMIEKADKYIKGNILHVVHVVQSPTLCKYRPKLTEKLSNIVIKQTAHHQSPLSTRNLERSSANKSFASVPETSIEQIKGKIQQYLTFNSETSPLGKYANQLFTEVPRRTTQEHFRISILKCNNKKKVNLKLIEDNNPERYGSLGKQFSVSEACMNRRSPFKDSRQLQFIKRRHRNRILDLKRNYDVKRYPYTKREHVTMNKIKKGTTLYEEGRLGTPSRWQDYDEGLDLPFC